MTSVASTSVEGQTKRSLGDLVEMAWIWSVVGYSLLRFVIAWGAFSDHGANPWIFGVIDVGTAWPYAKAVATVTRRVASSHWAALPVPLGIALVTFFAPYGYLWFAAGEMPDGMRVGLAICVGVLLLAASAGVISKARKLRRAARPAVVLDVRNAQATSVPSEVTIDLTGPEVVIERSPVRPEVTGAD